MIVDLMGQASGCVHGLAALADWSAHATTAGVRAVADAATVQAPPPRDDEGLIDWFSRKLREFRVMVLLAVWVFVAVMVGYVYAKSKGSWGATLAAIILGAVVLAGVHNMDALQGNVGAEIDSAPRPDGTSFANR